MSLFVSIQQSSDPDTQRSGEVRLERCQSLATPLHHVKFVAQDMPLYADLTQRAVIEFPAPIRASRAPPSPVVGLCAAEPGGAGRTWMCGVRARGLTPGTPADSA